MPDVGSFFSIFSMGYAYVGTPVARPAGFDRSQVRGEVFLEKPQPLEGARTHRKKTLSQNGFGSGGDHGDVKLTGREGRREPFCE